MQPRSSNNSNNLRGADTIIIIIIIIVTYYVTYKKPRLKVVETIGTKYYQNTIGE